MGVQEIELGEGSGGKKGRIEYDHIDDKKDLHPSRYLRNKNKMTRCGMLVLLIACTSSVLIGTAIGIHIKYVDSLGYLKAKPVSSTGHAFHTSFLVVGNMGEVDGEDYTIQEEVGREMAYVGALLKPDFVVSAGDNFLPSGLKEPADPRFNTTFTSVYAKWPSLQVDWYAVLGEHDYGEGNTNANGLDESSPLHQMTSLNGENLGPYWKCCGGRRVGFVVKQHKDLDLFFVDTSPLVHKYYNKPWAAYQGGILAERPKQDAQLDLLESQLEQSKASWKIVVGHHPIRSNGLSGDTPELERLREILKRHGVCIYLSAHDLALQDIEDEDKGHLHYVGSGTGGAAQVDKRGLCCNKPKYFAAEPGFVTIALSKMELRVQFWAREAKLLHEYEINRLKMNR